MELTRHATAVSLLAVAGEFLVAREAEHNMPLGILGTLVDRPELYEEPPYLATVGDREGLALVAVRTPPYGGVLSEAGADGARLASAVEALVRDLATADPRCAA